MALPSFDGFELNTDNYIVEKINGERGMPSRILFVNQTARREGGRLIGEEFSFKPVTLEGRIVADTLTDFRSKLDDIKKNLQGQEKDLKFRDDRTYKATVSSLQVTQENEEITIGKFVVVFDISESFASGASETVTIPTASGTITQTIDLTVSGTTFARPVITYNAPTNDTTSSPTSTSGVKIEHIPTGTSVTWSGTGSNAFVTYSGTLAFNYSTINVSFNGETDVFDGFLPTFDPGVNQLDFTFGGAVVGGSITIQYNPKYL